MSASKHMLSMKLVGDDAVRASRCMRALAGIEDPEKAVRELVALPDKLLAGLKGRPATDATWDAGYVTGIEAAAACVRAALAPFHDSEHGRQS